MGRAPDDRLEGGAAGRSPVRVSPHAGLRAGDAVRVRRGPGAGAAGRSLGADANRAGGRSEVKKGTVSATREKRAPVSQEVEEAGSPAKPLRIDRTEVYAGACSWAVNHFVKEGGFYPKLASSGA